MKEHLVAKLLFEYFSDPSLVAEVTGWEQSALNSDDLLPEVDFLDWTIKSDSENDRKKPTRRYFSEADKGWVISIYWCLNELSEKSLLAKLSAINKSRNGLFALDREDYLFWARKASWLHDETIALLVGLVPTDMTVSIVSKIERSHIGLGYFFRELWERQELYYEAKNSYIVEEMDNAVQIVDWAERLDLYTPDGLARAVRKFHGTPEELGSTIDESQIDSREKTSLLQVIVLMAKDGYCYNEVGRSDVPTTLFDAADRNGVSITKETIRKHLRAAAEILKEPWKLE